jgi:aminopeptidase N
MSCTRHTDHGALAGAHRAGGAAGRLPFALPGSPRRFARDRAVDLEHVVLDLDVDFESKSLSGTVTHRLRALRPGVRRVRLDAVEMEVSEVTLDGRPIDFRHDGRQLTIRTERPLKEGRTAELAVRYSCTPRRGFYFLEADGAHPRRPRHAWSQGQDEDSRHWWPVFDYPNEKVSTEMIATVPADTFALSNGRLVSNRKRGGRRRVHWHQEIPHVPYLVTLVVGPFERIEQRAGDVPLTTWCLPGRRDEARRTVAGTAQMLELFGRLTGVAYPYAKYDQVFVEGFIFGGMENTSATTLTDLVLHDERAALDYTAEDLISHELAHQWWGNLVTCRDWSQAWLNEGFATYFELVWKEEARGEDEAWALRRELKEQYLEEDRNAYRRPVACRDYAEPIELFDAHLYQKGAWVVSMLRDRLGDALFWRTLKTYLREHRGGNVETADLRRAVEAASGRNFERFFEQWIDRAGFPELSVECEWDDEAGECRLEIAQRQGGDDTPACFELDLEVAFLVDGQCRRESIELARARQLFTFALASEPEACCIDPRERVLATTTFERPVVPLERTLLAAPWAPARAEAAAALGVDGSPRAVRALARALRGDPFWRVQAAAAAALGVARGEAARRALERALRSADHPKTRRAAAEALGAFRDAAATRALRRVVQGGDESYFVEAAASRALGRTRQPGALEVLKEALATRRRSWNEVVRCGAIAGLASLGAAHRDEVVEALVPWPQPRRFVRCRQAAAQALGEIGMGSGVAREALERLLEDSEFRVVLTAAQALGVLGDERSAGALARLADTALDGRVMRAARDASRRLGSPESGRAQRALDEVESIRQDHRRLADRLARLEERLEALEGP